MLYPSAGQVRVFGLSPTDNPMAVKERIGYVGEETALRGGRTLRELIAFYRAIFPKWDDALEREILDRFALSPKARISRLSKGQRRQVALVCAVCHRPDLLLLDEPASGLDPATRREFLMSCEPSVSTADDIMSRVRSCNDAVVLVFEGRASILISNRPVNSVLSITGRGSGCGGGQDTREPSFSIHGSQWNRGDVDGSREFVNLQRLMIELDTAYLFSIIE